MVGEIVAPKVISLITVLYIYHSRALGIALVGNGNAVTVVLGDLDNVPDRLYFVHIELAVFSLDIAA